MSGISLRFVACAVACMAMLGSVQTFATEPRSLFQMDGKAYAESDLEPKLRERVYDAYIAYRLAIQGVVRDAAFELHVQAEAKRSGDSPATVRAKLIPSDAISDDEIEKFYRANQARIRMPLAQVKGRIGSFLVGQRETLARAAVADKLNAAGSLEEMLPVAVVPKMTIDTAGFASKGPDQALVTVVEFADYQCPHCKEVSPLVQEIMKRYDGKVRVVFMDFPFNPSGISRLVSEGGVCAMEQGKFWAYHDQAFEDQITLTKDAPLEIAEEVGLDLAAFKSCVASQRPKDYVARAEGQAERLGVSSTPTLYVNGQRLRVTRGLGPDLDAAVKAALGAPGA